MAFSFRQRPVVAAAALAASLAFVPLAAQQQERVDYDAIYRIKDEGFARSQIMNIMSWLTDVYGPRLTNSPGFRKAGEWAVTEMTSWGLANVKLEPWETPAGPFGRGWSNDQFLMQATTPGATFPIIGMSTAWTPGTNGHVKGDAIHAVIETPEDIARYKGQLRGKFVLTSPMRDVPALWTPIGQRYTEEQLAALQSETDAMPRGGRAGGPGRQGGPGGGRGGAQNFAQQRAQFFKDEGALALITTASRSDSGNILLGGVAANRAPNATDLGLPQIVIAMENYGRIVRTLERKMPVTIEANIVNTFHDDTSSFNVMAEIPGTDKADEIVMLGAHFDSWHGGTGATDNAAGSAVMMEAMRILKQSGVRLRRTVRMGLWGGEEQGLLGSRAYVRQHFADPATMALKPAHAKFSAYFNLDNGTGAIRGIYLQGNEAIAPVFETWMKPFNNLGMTTLTIRDTGGTDHQAFDAVGLPGFQFIQDPVEYSTRTHHTNMDTYERIQEEDMRKNAVIVASFVYHAANRDQLLPRKPLPRPQGGGRGTQ
ncbi:MAG TPA: M20/M25/M40 family metallo-hydrolase [Vicinamibacterales bacterium]|nr:M20/M25/M40 family metallo-hydrolase [Vicinamibacterales bacterium]